MLTIVVVAGLNALCLTQRHSARIPHVALLRVTTVGSTRMAILAMAARCKYRDLEGLEETRPAVDVEPGFHQPHRTEGETTGGKHTAGASSFGSQKACRGDRMGGTSGLHTIRRRGPISSNGAYTRHRTDTL